MKSSIAFDPEFTGRLAAFWDTEQTYRGNSIYEPAAHVTNEAVFPAGYTEQEAIDECIAQSDCFGDHVCICRIIGGCDITQLKRIDFDTDSET